MSSRGDFIAEGSREQEDRSWTRDASEYLSMTIRRILKLRGDYMHRRHQQPSRNRREFSRRMFLRGAGVAMALPWLESVPVWGADAAATAAGATGDAPRRFAALFMGCGINPDHWSASGAGETME